MPRPWPETVDPSQSFVVVFRNLSRSEYAVVHGGVTICHLGHRIPWGQCSPGGRVDATFALEPTDHDLPDLSGLKLGLQLCVVE
jgi:hypothetical protein